MPLNLYRYDGHSEKVFAVRPLRVHGFIYGGSGNAGMGFSVKPPFWVRGFIHGGAVRPPWAFGHRNRFSGNVPHGFPVFGHRRRNLKYRYNGFNG